MSKFKAGDTVRRLVGGSPRYTAGTISTVQEYLDDRNMFLVGASESAVMPQYYELVAYKSQYLTPQQTLENLLTDVPTQAQHCGEWLDIKELDNVSVNFLKSMKCRKKPETVRIGEYEVVKPQQRINIEDTRTRYVIKQVLQNVEEVQPDFLLDSRLFWDTREDAYAALQAIKKTLLGETK